MITLKRNMFKVVRMGRIVKRAKVWRHEYTGGSIYEHRLRVCDYRRPKVLDQSYLFRKYLGQLQSRLTMRLRAEWSDRKLWNDLQCTEIVDDMLAQFMFEKGMFATKEEAHRYILARVMQTTYNRLYIPANAVVISKEQLYAQAFGS